MLEKYLKRHHEIKAAETTTPSGIWRYAWQLAAIWTIIVSASLAWNIILHKQRTTKIALIEAKTVFEKDLIYYRWASGHHGVFVPVTKTTQPNKYLYGMPDQKGYTASGRELTLVNPEYMIRQVYEMAITRYGPYGHITSLDPIRPENAADPWEEKALEAFENGVDEVHSIEDINGEKFLRLMRPMYTESGCLQCHEGYSLGDIRGGISVSIPMGPLLSIYKHDIFTFCFAHGVMWFLGLMGICLGVRRLSESMRKRQQAETRVRSIIENMFDGLITLNARGLVESCNSAASRMFDYSPSEMLGLHIGGLIRAPDETNDPSLPEQEIPAEIMKAMEAPRELTGRTKEGGHFGLEISLSEMLLGQNRLYIAMVRDITERNMAKDALWDSQTRIIKQEKLASLGTMVAGIAHEINNPSQAISFSMDGLKMNIEYVKELVTELKKYLGAEAADLAEERENIRRLMTELDMDLVLEGINDLAERNIESVERIDHIVKSTKRMAYSDEKFSTCHLNTIIDDAVVLTHNQVKYDLEIETRLADNLPAFQGMAQELGQVFMNLIMNARDSIREKGLSKKEGRIIISTRYVPQRKCLEARFEDNGTGIKQEIINNIFDPFFTTKDIGSGTGLGLNLCHRIIDTHGGEISVESEPGEGACFTIRLYV